MENLFDRIAAKCEDAVALTQALVRVPSVNPPGCYYRDCAEIIGERLRRRGFEVRYLRAEGSPGDSARYPRDNVVARWEGSRPGPCVHFNGHIDVVPAGGGWSFEPFAASVHDGRIYGRGTCDMKGGLAAAIVAVEALIEAYPDLPGAIEVSGTADEETGGYGGVAYLAERGYFSKPRVDHVIIPEPLNVDRVCLGHRGVWWAEVETQGHGAHGSMPFLGDCAVRHMGAFVQRLEEELFPSLERRRTDMPVVPAGAKRSTLNLNAVHGGLAEGYEGLPAAIVPESCRLVIDRRFPEEETLETVRGEIVALLEDLEATRPDFRFALRDVMSVEPTMTEAGAPVVTALAQAIERVLGRPAELVASPGTYDQKHIARIGKLKDCVAYGPGILDLAHQPNEFVVIDDMIQSARVMAAATLGLLGYEVR